MSNAGVGFTEDLLSFHDKNEFCSFEETYGGKQEQLVKGHLSS